MFGGLSFILNSEIILKKNQYILHINIYALICVFKNKK